MKGGDIMLRLSLLEITGDGDGHPGILNGKKLAELFHNDLHIATIVSVSLEDGRLDFHLKNGRCSASGGKSRAHTYHDSFVSKEVPIEEHGDGSYWFYPSPDNKDVCIIFPEGCTVKETKSGSLEVLKDSGDSGIEDLAA